jgi:hypothetical protein
MTGGALPTSAVHNTAVNYGPQLSGNEWLSGQINDLVPHLPLVGAGVTSTIGSLLGDTETTGGNPSADFCWGSPRFNFMEPSAQLGGLSIPLVQFGGGDTNSVHNMGYGEASGITPSIPKQNGQPA